ncbi:MAG: hypothetical protein V3R80_14030 [Candidatus Tectomicrobia bacterium]
MTTLLQQQKRIIVGTLIAANILFPLFIVLWGHYVDGVGWHRIERLIDREGNSITWFSSVQLLLTGLVAYATYVATQLNDLRDGQETPYRWAWLFLAFGFVFLACDEFFMYHEQLRERILKPNRVLTDIPKFNPGDAGLFVYLAVGLTMSYFFVQILRSNRSSVVLFVSAIAVITPLVILDGFYFEFIRDNPTVRTTYNMIEEIGENIAGLLFLLSFLMILFDRLQPLLTPPGGGRSEATSRTSS